RSKHVRPVSASGARRTGGGARRRTRWERCSARSPFAGACTSAWSRASRAVGHWSCGWEWSPGWQHRHWPSGPVAGRPTTDDRRGKRLGTVYLGRMPEPGQQRLTEQMTAVLTAALTTWHALGRPCPRLVYLSDGGHHPQQFFHRVLARLADPWRPNRYLPWRW